MDRNIIRQSFKFFLPAITTLLLGFPTGCSWAPGHHLTSADLDTSQSISASESLPPLITITAEMIAQQEAARLEKKLPLSTFPSEAIPYDDYTIGPGDILSVIVWDHPELTIPAGAYRSPEGAGNLVDARGRIFYPYVGEIEVAGLTIAQVRKLICEKLSQDIKNPQVDLRVAAFRSKKVLVTGEIKTPKVIPLTDRPMTLLEAVNLAGGPTDHADLRDVRLTRKGDVSQVDLLALYKGGLTAPIVLQPNDQVYIPDNNDNNVYIMGEVSKPMVVPMSHRRLTLADALGAGGGISSENADASQIFVIREEDAQAKIYQLNGNSPDSLLLTTTFNLEKHDIIYVAPAGLTIWNRVIGKLLPTVQTIWQTHNMIDNW
ncbi:MAG: polysaccharide export protein [Thermodesulfobacteriota bacterium]